MKSAVIYEGDQYIGTFDEESAPNEFIRGLVREAIDAGEARAIDEEGMEVTARISCPNKFINFFPGSMREDRETLISHEPLYGLESCLEHFLDSMICGNTASISAEGIAEALDDQTLLATFDFEESALEEAVAELRAAFAVENRTQQMFGDAQ